MSLTKDSASFCRPSVPLPLSLPAGYKSQRGELKFDIQQSTTETKLFPQEKEEDLLYGHWLLFGRKISSHNTNQMDRGMSVSLWCEEVEDELTQEQTGAPVEDQVRGSSQLRAAWDPTVSGHRVIQRLLHIEERYMPSMLYITLIQRDPERREELAKWALEVQYESLPTCCWKCCVTIATEMLMSSIFCSSSAGVL